MPIANCIVTPSCQKRLDSSSDLIELWSSASNISSEHMTINIITSSEQLGNKYPLMVTLILPSIWSNADISSLQLGLAKAMSRYFNVNLEDVFISTNIVNSGMVVEAGKEVKW